MINDPWKSLPRGEMRRVEEDGKYNYFWASLETGQSALILFLPLGLPPPKDIPKLRNMDLSYQALPQPIFMVALKDPSHRNIFSILCQNIVRAGELSKDAESAFNASIARARRWHFLLKAGSAESLSLEQQRGLVGELACLRTLIQTIGPAAAVEAWRGPEGASRDFELPNLVIEVKAKREGAKPFVRISSEEQLANFANGKLLLRIYDIQNAVQPEGFDLHDHVNQTLAMCRAHAQASLRMETLLAEVGYDSMDDYSGRRWIITRCRTFNVKEGFPRVVPPVLLGVSGITYNVAIDACEQYLCDTDPIECLELN